MAEELTEFEPIDNQDIATVPQEPPTLSVEERLDIAKSAAPEHASLLGQLVEIQKTAEVLRQLDNTETRQQRSDVLNMIFESFLHKRMVTNNRIEELKSKLVESILVDDNFLNLDLTTRVETIEKLHNMGLLLEQRPIGSVGAPAPEIQAAPSTVIQNFASGSGAQSVEVSGGQVESLKEVGQMNTAVKAWMNIPKKTKVVAEVNEDGTTSS